MVPAALQEQTLVYAAITVRLEWIVVKESLKKLCALLKVSQDEWNALIFL